MAEMQNYTNESIRSLTDRDTVRLRTETFFQERNERAIEHTLIEIVGNSLDEHEQGFGDKIIVKRYADGAISVKDFGRGIPMDWNNAEKKYNSELLFETLFAGGKYDKTNYKISVGLNGVGLAITQLSSVYTEVEVIRDGHKYTQSFKNGYRVTELKKEPSNEPNGSFVKWLPDLEVFNTAETVYLSKEFFNNFFTGLVLQDETLTIEFEDEYLGTSQVYKDVDLIKYLGINPSKFISEVLEFSLEGTTKDSSKGKEYYYKADVQVVFTKPDGNCVYFHNMMKVTSGVHEKSLTRGCALALERKGVSLSSGDILKYLVSFIKTKSTETSYSGQAKGSVNSKGIENVLANKFTEVFYKEFERNPALVKYFKELSKIRKKAYEDEQKISKVMQKVTETFEKQYEEKISKTPKFVDCVTKDKSKREIYIVEGDSAYGSVITARDKEIQAVIAGQGKIKNALKDSINSTLTNGTILNILEKLKCGLEVRTETRVFNSFDMRLLDWDKIIICTDGDVDGFQIRCLYLAMLYKFTPSLIKEGKVYIVESPLFTIEYQGKRYYAYSDAEKNEIIKDKNGCKIKRSKGLGENSPDMMWETTMNPETRKLTQVTSSDMDYVLEVMLGDYLEERKEYIDNLFEDYCEE